MRRSSRSVRSGYAFAHQAGFGELITSGINMKDRAKDKDSSTVVLTKVIRGFGDGGSSNGKPHQVDLQKTHNWRSDPMDGPAMENHLRTGSTRTDNSRNGGSSIVFVERL